MPRFRIEIMFDDQSTDLCYQTAEDEIEALHSVLHMPAQKVTITRIEPTDWEKYGPPQVGDIWEVDGEEWVSTYSMNPDHEEKVYLIGIDNVVSRTVKEVKDRNPRLVRRRGECL